MERFIVAEICKNWKAGSEERDLLAQRFEKVININLKRGYISKDWKTHVFIIDGVVNETIIAIFERIDSNA